MTADELDIVRVDPQDEDAVACLRAYFAELNRRFAQGFDVTLSSDPEADSMRPPRGAFILIRHGDQSVACGGLKGHGTWGEVKRVWVANALRGQGLARRLMARIEDEARDLGMDVLRLDTNSALPEAVAMYRRLGWTEIPRFNDDPYPDVFFERQL
ncbi:putative acetyltransferase [Roseivivax sp. THAF40]|uniref:GNAT family N-acetyltransferase n=1 Tax=unclassified Roseivivax TaxID=2639302 RepID=UPI001268570B|nr:MULTISPECIES: GNAT family N-acetyltransferase [unclassified Roseivivax]QFS81516.1 putative acetyltransferase [Roseivivax sp. THAF197b]QFT45245.1 putative acetyltransferase [Roseivivax sp. THAF40]